MEEEEKSELSSQVIVIIVTAILLIAVHFLTSYVELQYHIQFLIYFALYLFIGFSVIKEAFENVFKGEIFDENFLMTIATASAMFIGFLPNAEPMFGEAIFVMLFYKIGELFETIAERKNDKSLESVLEIKPDVAYLFKDGTRKKENPQNVQIGDIINVLPGEKIPLDGIVTEGESSQNIAFLTGESKPSTLKVGDEVYSGAINLTGEIKVEVTKNFENSSANKIIELIKNASEHKSKSERFITSFAKIYTPVVVLIAVILAFGVPFILGDFEQHFTPWLIRALTFLIISCPCALVISIPLCFFGGIGTSAKNGILIKGSEHIENLSKLSTIVFDKTGTVTKGAFEVSVVHGNNFTEEELLHLASHIESFSNHPIAVSLKEAYKKHCDECEVSNIKEFSGEGIVGTVNNESIYVGNNKLMDRFNITVVPCEHPGATIIHVAKEQTYLGHIVIEDELKPNVVKEISTLKAHKITTIMLSGDKEDVTKNIAKELSIDKYYAELLPQDKVSLLEETLKNSGKKKVAFVGDGINDAPVISRADVGIAMGAIGSDAAIDVADVVIMDDNIGKINTAISISNKALRIAYQNIAFTLVFKFLALILAFLGYAPMWLATFADVGVTVIAILNSLRTLKK